ncbi:hypothetical protein POJ06DRAFT_222933 [Lipomyces tetrasporus]|uniref:Uncharacterized protein n=1 Tax=Lipomyces tetrasporus TaxID=54092 RepID=A0AAD7QSD3_9ASCO|nr:uncharacterized protein POJ06DRAFT_222933 [Lipomyces tetrasporus]KAJ8100639.1 hypothetical protein POJ06DRAFT_222933 [Lipomyces tetrasporus]
MRAELKEIEVASDGIHEDGKSGYQPASDEDNGDEEECNDIGRLSRLRDSKKIQLFFCHVLASDPTGMALRGLLRDMELWDVHMIENYFKALCDWKLEIGTVNYEALKIPRVIPDTARLEQYGSEVQRYAGELEKYALSLIDVVAVVFAILNVLGGQQLPIRPLLDYAVDMCPELILIGAVQLETPWMPIEFDAINDLLDVYYRSENRVPRLFVLGTLWQVNRDALTSFLVEKYKLQPMQIHQIAQLITDLGVAPSLVNVRPYKFALHLYTNLSVRGEFSISRYLTSVTNSTGVEFTVDMLDFLDDLINDSSKRCTMGLTEVSEFMRVLSELSIPLSYIDRWHRVREQCVTYPRLVVFGRGLELISIFNQNLSSEFSDSIIAEVDAKIEDLRSFQVHVFESIEYLKVLHKSTSPISQDLVARMMSLIFERNMNLVGLPLEDVAMFSTLLGLLIKNRLIVGTHLTVALERIVRSLSNYPPESTVFKAALNTAMHVVDALDICPHKFCDTLAGLDDLANFAPDLWRVARDTRVRRNLAVEYGRAATHIGQECFEIPVQVTKQKIHDILQSLSTDTVPMVVNELGAILNDETCSNWFVDYLVGTLISHKLSQHDTYLELLTAIKSDELNSMVLRRTFNFSLTLIKSEETVHLTSELAKVSNLGTWLGKYTLRRNKPIKANHICFKKLLRLGDEIGRLSVVVGFTCRVLEQAAKSIVFTASNAWIIGVLRALLEVFEYKIGDATWKDDIKALFKTLRADMQNVAAAARAEHARVADFHTDDLIANFELLSKRIDKKVAQVRGLVKNTVDAMWHKCMGCIEPPPACMLVLINCIEESIEALLSEGLESAVALEDARKKIEEGAGNCRDEIYKQNIEQQAAAHFSAYLERNGYSYVTSHQTNVLTKAMDAVRTHLYELIYNKITEEVNRSMLVMMRGTAFSPLKLRTTRDIHHPGQSEAEKISPVRAEADRDIRQIVEIADPPKKRPDVFPAGRSDDRDEFSMARLIY